VSGRCADPPTKGVRKMRITRIEESSADYTVKINCRKKRCQEDIAIVLIDIKVSGEPYQGREREVLESNRDISIYSASLI
jgi:hypothetical protein